MHSPVVSVGREETLWAAMSLMLTTNLHHLAVVDAGGAFGLINDRDLAAVWATNPLGLKNLTVEHVLGDVRAVVVPTTDVVMAGEVMLRQAVDAVLVIDESGSAVGVLTDHDLLNVFVGLHRAGDDRRLPRDRRIPQA
ncbi:CBS domain-containing protein (plasmid) [Embleya sp. NBC_00888]|uniref:CBS domain-containing protein n=1 Tax=Embleya sp. NBC_00888 TaxID=2975960 RepID=UPI002F9119F9|nr:CBS domain-containing protein [Embleya sp. NBC_00888]